MKMKAIYHSGRKESVFYEQDIKTPFPLRALSCISFQNRIEMKRKGIKNLIFDFGGVLINLDRQRCIENFRKLGLEKVDELLGMYSQQGIFMQHEKG